MAEKAPTISQITGRAVLPTGVALLDVAGLPEVRSDAIIGIEIEVERCKVSSRNLSKVWEVKEDGSLRNQGNEFVTRPINAKDAPKLLNNLLQQALDRKESSFSMRTSIHVHLNMLDFTTKELQNVVLLYCLFETLFYQYAGRGRWKNIYCVPINSTNLLYGFIRRGLRISWQKYTGLNLRPLAELGTIEFRHLSGMFEVERVVGWINLITALRDYVKSQDEVQLQKRLQFLPDDLDLTDMAREVFGQYADLLEITDPFALQQGIPAMKMAFLYNEREAEVFSLARPGLARAAREAGVNGFMV